MADRKSPIKIDSNTELMLMAEGGETPDFVSDADALAMEDPQATRAGQGFKQLGQQFESGPAISKASQEGVEPESDPLTDIAGGYLGSKLASGAGEILGNEAGAIGRQLSNTPKARAARANKMGFDTSKTYYHGTKADIEAFNPETLGASTNAQSAKQGYFFASDPSTAGDYAELSPARNVLRAKATEAESWKPVEDAYNKLVDKYGLKWKTSKQIQELRDSGTGEAILKHGEIKEVPDNDPLLKEYESARQAAVDYENSLTPLTSSEKFDIENQIYSLKRLTPKAIKENKNKLTALQKRLDQSTALIEQKNYGQNVIPVHLKMENPYVHDFKSTGYRDESYASIMTKAKKAGHDSVIFKNTYDPANPENRIKQDIVAVFEPHQIRSKHAKFNPKEAKSGKLSYAMGGLADEESYFAEGGDAQLPGFVSDEQMSQLESQSGQQPGFISDEQMSHLQSDEDRQQEQYGTPGQQLKAGLEGAAQGLVGPIAPLAEQALGVKPEDIRGRAEANPYTHYASEAAGLIGPALLTGGASGAARITQAGALEALGKVLPEATTLAGRIGMSAAKGAIDNMLISGSDEVSKMILQDPNQSVQTALTDIGLSAALGGGISGLASGISPLWKATVGDKTSKMIQDFKGRINEHLMNPEPVNAVKYELGEYYDQAKSLSNISTLYDQAAEAENVPAMRSLMKSQGKIEEAFKAYQPALKAFESKFTTLGAAGERVIDPGKINTYMNQIGKPNAEIKQSILRNFLDASEKYKKVINGEYSGLEQNAPMLNTPMNSTLSTLGERTTGGKLADAFISKGLTHEGSKSLGAAFGAGVGGILGGHSGATLGAILGSHSLGPFFNSVLPGIANKLVNTAANSTGFKAVLDHGMAVAKGDMLISKAAKNLFKVGSAVLTESQVPSHKDLEKLNRKLATIQTDPDKLYQSRTTDLSHYLPDHSSAADLTISNAVSQLNSMRPDRSRMAPLDSKPVLSNTQKADFTNALTIAQQPLVVMDKIKKGTITAKDVMLIQSLYPSLYNGLKQKITNEMILHVNKGEIVPYKTRVGLSMFMAQPLDSTMSPLSIQAAQLQPAMQKQAAAQAPEGKGGTKSSPALQKMGKMYQTPGQAKEEHRTKE